MVHVRRLAPLGHGSQRNPDVGSVVNVGANECANRTTEALDRQAAEPKRPHPVAAFERRESPLGFSARRQQSPERSSTHRLQRLATEGLPHGPNQLLVQA